MSDLNSSDDSSGSDFNIEKSPKYNILTRPKRRINSEKVSNIDHTCLSSSESEDEDFVPGSDEINDDINNFSDESIDSEQETENENKNFDGIKNEETDREFSIILENPCKISNRNSNAVRDSSIPVKRGPYKKVKDGIKTTKKERNVKTTATKSNVTKTKKRKYKKHQVFGNPMSDEETKKFISNFKNSKIKMEKKNKSKKIKKTCINNEDSTMTYKTAGTSNTGRNNFLKCSYDLFLIYFILKGPCVKCHIHTTDSTSFPIYGVYQSHSETSESVVQRVGFTRERIPPIINQKSPWTCVFCHNRSEFINGIGCLFGPYRLSTDPDEEDITVEYKPCIEINKKLFT